MQILIALGEFLAKMSNKLLFLMRSCPAQREITSCMICSVRYCLRVLNIVTLPRVKGVCHYHRSCSFKIYK